MRLVPATSPSPICVATLKEKDSTPITYLNVLNIRGNQTSVGPRLEFRRTCSRYNKLTDYCVIFVTVILQSLPDNMILKLICLFIRLFCLQNAKMAKIYWFYLTLKSRSYKGYAGCAFTRQYTGDQSCGNTILDLYYPCQQKLILSMCCLNKTII